MSGTAYWCGTCGHWENWHDENGCEVCAGASVPRIALAAGHRFVRGEARRINGPVGRDLQSAGRP